MPSPTPDRAHHLEQLWCPFLTAARFAEVAQYFAAKATVAKCDAVRGEINCRSSLRRSHSGYARCLYNTTSGMCEVGDYMRCAGDNVRRVEMVEENAFRCAPFTQLLPSTKESSQPVNLPGAVCDSLSPKRVLGKGFARTTWESELSRMPGMTVVQKVTNLPNSSAESGQVVELRSRAQKLQTYREAILLHDLHTQYGRQASVCFSGICDETAVIMEKLDVLNESFLHGLHSVAYLQMYIERMVNFTAGPLIMRDLKWRNLGQSTRGHVHAIDLGSVRVQGRATVPSRAAALLVTLEQFSDLINGAPDIDDAKVRLPWPNFS